jgi:hypothetical protein
LIDALTNCQGLYAAVCQRHQTPAALLAASLPILAEAAWAVMLKPACMRGTMRFLLCGRDDNGKV